MTGQPFSKYALPFSKTGRIARLSLSCFEENKSLWGKWAEPWKIIALNQVNVLE
ncbi:hypothetical protein ACFFGV_12025 [Pontibacillus salicampi]|uniref:Uncharacterized protein n=1 Tax=Pontibacillus salicampi TaxID=1449801 RepID=A0ABV6LPT4_9BACI